MDIIVIKTLPPLLASYNGRLTVKTLTKTKVRLMLYFSFLFPSFKEECVRYSLNWLGNLK